MDDDKELKKGKYRSIIHAALLEEKRKERQKEYHYLIRRDAVMP